MTCHTCNGDGAKPGTSKTCSYCNGAGHVSVEQNTILGRVRTQQTCPKCDGTGQEFEEPCPTCHGKGIENKTVKLEVTVPEGVDNDQQIRLAGKEHQEKTADHMATCMSYLGSNHLINLNVTETIFITI